MGAFFRVISGGKVPYLITVLFLACGWVTTYSVQRIDNSPTVIFDRRETTTCRPGENGAAYGVENITRTVRLHDLRFVIVIDGGSAKAERAAIYPTPPSWSGSSQPSTAGKSASFDIADFQPGDQFTLESCYSGIGDAHLYLEDAHDTVRLVAPSLETYFAKHELELMLGILGIYLIFAVIIIVNSDSDISASGTTSEPIPATPCVPDEGE